MVLINTGTTSKLNRSTLPPPRSSTNQAIFTQFSFTQRINPKEWKRIGVFYYFQGQFHIFKGNFTKFQDNSRTNGTILKFQEFSRSKVKFKDFSRSVRTLALFAILLLLCGKISCFQFKGDCRKYYKVCEH